VLKQSNILNLRFIFNVSGDINRIAPKCTVRRKSIQIFISVFVKYISFMKSGLEAIRVGKYVKAAGIIFEVFI
jgi:hypothetical protein